MLAQLESMLFRFFVVEDRSLDAFNLYNGTQAAKSTTYPDRGEKA